MIFLIFLQIYEELLIFCGQISTVHRTTHSCDTTKYSELPWHYRYLTWSLIWQVVHASHMIFCPLVDGSEPISITGTIRCNNDFSVTSKQHYGIENRLSTSFHRGPHNSIFECIRQFSNIFKYPIGSLQKMIFSRLKLYHVPSIRHLQTILIFLPSSLTTRWKSLILNSVLTLHYYTASCPRN